MGSLHQCIVAKCGMYCYLTRFCDDTLEIFRLLLYHFLMKHGLLLYLCISVFVHEKLHGIMSFIMSLCYYPLCLLLCPLSVSFTSFILFLCHLCFIISEAHCVYACGMKCAISINDFPSYWYDVKDFI